MNQFRINTVAPAALTRACLPLLAQSPDASVLAVGESHGLHPGPYWGGFAVSHAGLPHWVKMAASRWDVCPNLRINLLVPGPCSRRNAPTHPGEAKPKCRQPTAWCRPSCTGWARKAVGKSGQIIELNPQR